MEKNKLKEIVDCIETKWGLVNEMDNSKRKYIDLHDYIVNTCTPYFIRKGGIQNNPSVIETKIYYVLLRERAVKLRMSMREYPENLENLTK